MKPFKALNLYRDEIRNIVDRHRVRNARVFGSVLHGEDADGSDLDLLVDPMPTTTLFDLGGLQIELEEVLGVPVDVITPGDLPAKLRDQVLREASPL